VPLTGESAMLVQVCKVTAIKQYGQNPRNNDGVVDTVANSTREYGFRQPIVVDADHAIVVGHTR
jgi:ParB-like chromosome segregation protein Spo0J